MALRPIDNALPEPVERPKKQAKLEKQLTAADKNKGLGDENEAPLAIAGTDVSIDYIASDDLEALPDPINTMKGLIEGLESKDWMKVCESLNDSRRLALHHSDLLLPVLEKVMLVLVKSMKNPRSALCKTAIMSASDVFSAYGDQLLENTAASAAFDQLLLQLLLKASQDKKFVCEEAAIALRKMIGSLTPLPLLGMLKGYAKHANFRVRAKVAVCITNAVTKMGLDEMKEFGLVTLVQMAVDLLNDRLPEAREAARSTLVLVYEAYTEKEEHKEEAWESFCQSNLSPVHAQATVKIISAQ